MSLEDVLLPKLYHNSKILFEQNLDAWRLAAQAGFADVQLNFTQIGKDVFGPGYEYNNDGDSTQSVSLSDRVNALAAGGAPITGTSSSTWTIGSSNPATLDTSLLSGSRTYNLPDLTGTFLLTSGAQSIGNLALTQTVFTTGSPNILNLIGGAHTTLAASTEASDVIFNLARTVQFATGALASQRAVKIMAPTYAGVGAMTITNAVSLYISGAPIAGANMTLTNSYALWVDSGFVQFDDDLNVGGDISAGGRMIAGYLDKGDVSGAVTIDWAVASTQRIRLTGNATLTFTNMLQGQKLTLIIAQDTTGSRTITWPTSVRWGNATGATDSTTDKPTLTTTASKVDILNFYYNSTLSLFWGLVGGYKFAIT